MEKEKKQLGVAFIVVLVAIVMAVSYTHLTLPTIGRV